ncbi:hypothetical protein [Mucilaginibacter psychrotolerans]|uniref:Uncharacterized protein n=1 Tax=Mucilaginibacter psychrotolerans TaxID=1524096 RepID=A0A4Y8SBL2_9SPHI|nr:hypothetical protein [Mucilaginibacter psychrotolerans]TFF35967.1 hypothetical protein E2R66_17265 [Mucilaginibacter psychrotolerans]
MITEIEQQTSDIDWFFTDGENIAFVASGGGKLPSSVSSSKHDTELLADYFWNDEIRSEFIINPSLKEIVGKADDLYLSDFVTMACKGLFAFDRTVLNHFADLNYHLVAVPTIPLKLSDLPSAIAAIVIKTKIKGTVDRDFNLNQFEA